MQQMEKHLQKIYRKEYSGLVRSWNEYMRRIEVEIQEKWNNYQDAIAVGDDSLETYAKKEYRKAVKEKTIMNDYYKGMVDQTVEQMAHVNETAVAYLNGEIPEIYSVNLNESNEFVKGYVAGYQFNLMDKNTAKQLLEGNKDYMDYFKQVNIPKDKRWNKKLIHAQITQGILQGESIPVLAKRFQNVTKSNEAAAIRNARTMTTGIANRGRMDGFDQAEEKGIIINDIWIATNSEKTRAWHLELDGVEKPHGKTFVNEYGKIRYPGDPAAHPANIYNCRCSISGRVIGFRNKDGEINYIDTKEESNNNEIKNIYQVKNKQEALNSLRKTFTDVDEKIEKLDEQLLVSNTNQFNKLNNRFKVIQINDGSFLSADNKKNAVAYAIGGLTGKGANLNLCSKYYKKLNVLLETEKKDISSFWSMPADSKYYGIYSITHEYGHLLEAKISRNRVNIKSIEEDMKKKYGNGYISHYIKKLAEKEKATAEDIRNEIIEIAKKNNKDFDLEKNLSRYGRTNDYEFFAEVFANSQLEKPNELGSAMKQWLKKEGY